MRLGLIGLCAAAALTASQVESNALWLNPLATSELNIQLQTEALAGDWYDPVAATIRDRMSRRPKAADARVEKDRQAIADAYASRGFAPFWIADGRLSRGAQAVIDRLARADSDGLDPRAFSAPAPDIGTIAAGRPEALADADFQLSQAVVAYARVASIGRIDPQTISPNIGYSLQPPEPGQSLLAVANATDPAAALASFNPPHPGFERLRAELARVRAAGPVVRPAAVASGKTVKPGQSDERIPALRVRLGVTVETDKPLVLDESTAGALKAFQQARGLSPDGTLGPGTVAALNAAAADPTAEIVANLERWRWLPRDLGRFNVQVNIPEFSLSVYRDGAVTHTTRVIVGQTDKQTPVFSDEIEHIIVNPSWNVPESIAVKEMMPAIQANPGAFFARNNYVVTATVNGRSQVIDPSRVDWRTINPRTVHFRQPPGANNALGNIKFMFPNQYAVYLHDTPSRTLFGQDFRALSHGCVRVNDPFAFAQALLVDDPQWDAAKIKKMVGGGERQLNLAQPVPVHLMYFTTWVDENGARQSRNDIYGISAAVQKALGLTGPGA
ncbi:MAG: L,D-transpeptidase family protein [Bauldia sp.]|mgnify:CR=1 FL=1